ncbi:hypothetical protein [Siansivirga zeaxanthinifaciens]|nr:hypothetical protein [Siansivirga zeaxanthinifaciens]
MIKTKNTTLFYHHFYYLLFDNQDPSQLELDVFEKFAIVLGIEPVIE